MADSIRELKKKVKGSGKGKVIAIEENLVDKVWHDRPARPENQVFVLADKFTGTPPSMSRHQFPYTRPHLLPFCMSEIFLSSWLSELSLWPKYPYSFVTKYPYPFVAKYPYSFAVQMFCS
jgi:hypothetical protein